MSPIGLSSVVMRRRAFAIADEAMLALLYAHCLYEDTPLGVALVPVDELGNRVQALGDAEEATQEAYKWLRDRGLAGLTRARRGYLLITIAFDEMG